MFWGQTTLHKKKIPSTRFMSTLIHVSWPNLVKIGGCKVNKMVLSLPQKKPLLRHRILWTTLAPYEGDHAHNSWKFLPLTSARIPNLVQSGWSLLDLFPKDFTLQTRKVIGRYGFQPTTTLRLVYENSSLSSWPINAFNANQPVA